MFNNVDVYSENIDIQCSFLQRASIAHFKIQAVVLLENIAHNEDSKLTEITFDCTTFFNLSLI